MVGNWSGVYVVTQRIRCGTNKYMYLPANSPRLGSGEGKRGEFGGVYKGTYGYVCRSSGGFPGQWGMGGWGPTGAN